MKNLYRSPCKAMLWQQAVSVGHQKVRPQFNPFEEGSNVLPASHLFRSILHQPATLFQLLLRLFVLLKESSL